MKSKKKEILNKSQEISAITIKLKGAVKESRDAALKTIEVLKTEEATSEILTTATTTAEIGVENLL